MSRISPAGNDASRRTGASLIELLVVIAIIAVLAALGTAIITSAMNFASNLQAEVDAAKTRLKFSKSTSVSSKQSTKSGYVPDQYIVVLADSSDPTATAARLQLTMPVQVVATFSTTFKGLSLTVPSSYLAALMQDPEVRFLEQDQYMVPSAQIIPTGVTRVGGGAASAPLNTNAPIAGTGTATTTTTISGNGGGSLINANVSQTTMTGFQQSFTTNGAAVASTTRPTVGFPFFANGNMVTNLANNVVQVPTTGPQGSGVINIGNGGGGSVVGIDVNLVIIDTGVALHRDLFVIESKSQQLTFAANPGLGNAVNNFVDTNGHGTLMAGIAAARDDTNDVVGVAPGAKIWACKAISPPAFVAGAAGSNEDDATAATMTIVTKAVDTLTQMRLAATSEQDKPHVAYIGFTTGTLPAAGVGLNTSITALVNAGTVVVVPAGNGGIDCKNVVPANCARAIVVGAMVDLNGTDASFGVVPGLLGPFPLAPPTVAIPTLVYSTNDGTAANPLAFGSGTSPNYLNMSRTGSGEEGIAEFSNRNVTPGGTNFVDFLAPGIEIQSTWPNNINPFTNTRRCTGTSAAAAHVAGIAVLAVDPNARMSQNVVNGRSIFNSLGYINQTPTPIIPDSVDFLMKNLYQYRDINQLFNNNGNMAPNAGAFPNNATITPRDAAGNIVGLPIPIANARLF